MIINKEHLTPKGLDKIKKSQQEWTKEEMLSWKILNLWVWVANKKKKETL